MTERKRGNLIHWGKKINEIVAGGDPNQCILVFNSEISATYSVEQIPVVKQYIINQKEHHRQTTFAEEYRRFIMDCGGEIDERFFLKD